MESPEDRPINIQGAGLAIEKAIQQLYEGCITATELQRLLLALVAEVNELAHRELAQALEPHLVEN